MLYECHGHIMLNGTSYKDAAALHKDCVDDMAIRRSLSICAEYGVRFYRDGGDKHMVSVRAKALAPEFGIDYRTPVCVIHKKGCYGGLLGRAFADMAEYRKLVLAAKRYGADFIKITASGMLDFGGTGGVMGTAPTASELQEMVNIAHGEGFAVMAHVNGAENIKNSLKAGVSSIEHGFFMDLEAITMLAETGAVWVPTLSAVAGLIGNSRFDDALLNTILERHKSALIKAFAKNVLISSGSDAGAVGVLQGEGTCFEYRLLDEINVPYERGNRKIAEIFKTR